MISLSRSKTLIAGIALLALAGCATSQPKPEWKLVDGAWVGPATTYQDGTNPRRADCLSPNGSTWCKTLGVGGAASEQWFNNLAPALDAIGKFK